MTKLIVSVLDATNIHGISGKSDVYTIVEFHGLIKKTTRKKGASPSWNEDLEFELGTNVLSSTDKLLVFIKEKASFGADKLYGQGEVELKGLMQQKEHEIYKTVDLLDSHKQPTSGVLNLKINYELPYELSVGDSTEGNLVGGANVPVDAGMDGVDDLNTSVEDLMAGAGEGDLVRKSSKISAVRRQMRNQHSTKVQDFQLRIKIVECRQLQGGNISPVCRAEVWHQVRQTRVKKETNSPFYDETFFFNFYTTANELFDQIITFSVYNSRLLRSDALIGSFKCDVGTIFDEQNHCLLHKWLLLCNPDDYLSGAKGFLKICAVLLGPGDVAPNFSVQYGQIDHDIESNMLRPAGVHVRLANFYLRLYRAEDLPKVKRSIVGKMFTSKKRKAMDSCVVFQFAGKEVKSSVRFHSDQPEWNEELKMNLEVSEDDTLPFVDPSLHHSF